MSYADFYAFLNNLQKLNVTFRKTKLEKIRL